MPTETTPPSSRPPATPQSMSAMWLTIETGPALSAGVDLVDVARLELAIRRTGASLLRRLCSDAELAGLPTEPRARIERVAAIFGVKESVLKALGGIAAGGRLRDICTANASRPGGTVALTGETGRQARSLGVRLVAGTAEPPLGTKMLLSWAVAEEVR